MSTVGRGTGTAVYPRDSSSSSDPASLSRYSGGQDPGSTLIPTSLFEIIKPLNDEEELIGTDIALDKPNGTLTIVNAGIYAFSYQTRIPGALTTQDPNAECTIALNVNHSAYFTSGQFSGKNFSGSDDLVTGFWGPYYLDAGTVVKVLVAYTFAGGGSFAPSYVSLTAQRVA